MTRTTGLITIAGADHQTGDDGFDRAVLVKGDRKSVV